MPADPSFRRQVDGQGSPAEPKRAMENLRADIDVGLQQIREGRVTVNSDEMWREIESRANQRFNDSEQESPNV